MRRFAAIPAHPQKQYTRRWRLYHFCGFYYPIREVIPIAIYHWNIGIVSRGKGKSAVAAAAYRSGEKLTNEWDGMTHDYTRKGGVVHTEIMLPPHAPPSFSDRSTLWNSVELYEKAGNAQLAREIDAALPIELSREEQIRLVREYCSSQFVSRGMCVDFVIHDTDSGNPHCHIMLTMRPLDERGAWAAKSKKEYDLDENGERIRLPSGRYKTHKVDLTGWNDKDNTLLWRKAWADYTNDFLERNGSPERIDHRSNAERGIDEIPTVHMGVAACQMEKKGIATEKGELNRNIQKANRLIREIRAQIGKLKEWIADLFKAREYPHIRRTENFSYLLFEHRVETAVVLHVVAHTESVNRRFLWQRTYRAPYVSHRFRGKPLHIADFQRLVVGAVVVWVEVVGHLWIAKHYHLVVFLHSSRQLLQCETVSRHTFDDGLVEMCGVVFCRVYGHLAVCRHGE